MARAIRAHDGRRDNGVRYPLLKAALSRLVEWLVWLWTRAGRRRGEAPWRRILVVEPFRLGDAALLGGMLAALRQAVPSAEIHVLLHPAAADLYREHWAVDRVHAAALPWVRWTTPRMRWSKFCRLVAELRRHRFDLGIDPRGDVRSQALLALVGCAQRAGLTRYLASNIRVRGHLLTDPVEAEAGLHRVALHEAILQRLGISSCNRGLSPAAERRSGGSCRVVISPGAGWEFRRWPIDRWIELVRRFAAWPDIEVRVIRPREEDIEMSRALEGAGPGVVGRATSLSEFLDELRRASVVVSPDSAAVHLASEWFGVPVVALFGPGVVPLYRPRSAGSVTIHHQERFPCAPCLQRRCVRPSDPCMSAITVDEVADAVLRILAESGTLSLMHGSPAPDGPDRTGADP